MTQQEALTILKTGRNVFLTGPAGSGKTYVLREYIKYLNELGASIGITASTGIAATHMGGVTIHSWSGIGINDDLTKSDIQAIAEKSHVKNKIKNTSILIIDEISMLHHFRLEMIDRVIKEIKQSEEPFGGMQVVFCGDFFQLPPVQKYGEKESHFAYHSPVWEKLGLKICYLHEQHRQNDDSYLSLLNAIRENAINKEMIDLLESRKKAEPKIITTKLYSHNINVDAENEAELKKINNRQYEYEMVTRGRGPLVEILKKSCLAPQTLKLKEGAKVMFVKNNFDEGYANGTLGVVVYCSPSEIRVKTNAGETINVEPESWRIEEDGKTKAEVTQYPLRLAWAITIHKSQGMSLDCAEIDLSQSFERGMGYVALSRVRSLDGLFLKGWNEISLLVNDEVLEKDKKFKKLSETSSFHIRSMDKKKLQEMHDEFESKISQSKKKEKKIDTVEQTKIMLEEGKSIKEIAKERGLKPGTILDHLEEIKAEDPSFNIYHLQNALPKQKFKTIYGAIKKIGISEGGVYRLAPVRETLGPKYSYDDIRLVRLFL